MKKFFTLAAMLVMALTASAGLTQKAQGGWFESCWMEFTGLSSDYTLYNGYVSADGGSSWTQLDGELIRSYGTYGRVDALGLTAGTNYKLKVVPVKDNTEITADEVISSAAMEVKNFNRQGFAHHNFSNVGAYNDNGTLKAGAKVLYVTSNTAKTVSMEVTSDNKGGKTKFTGLQAIVTAYQKGLETTPLCVRFIGEITADDMDGFDSSSEGLQIKGKSKDSELRMTFEGVGNDAFIHGFGFLVRNSKSVEMRNFGVATGMDDDISLDTDNSNIWIHHIDAFYGPNKGGDQKKGDGAIDVKSDSKYVTIDNCHFWDTGKSTMCGMKSESGPNYITYHHNWFDHSDSRHARIRTMSVHMYNNYYDGIAKYGSGATTGSSVFMDRNYFRACSKPMMISLQGADTKYGTDYKEAPTFSGEDGGMIKSFGNVIPSNAQYKPYSSTNKVEFDCYEVANATDPVPASVKTKEGATSYDNFDTSATLMYAYNADDAANIPDIVTNRTWGAGRCQGGDFKFTFTNADDASYAVNEALRSAIDNYEPTLVGIIGTEDGGSSTPEPIDPSDTRAESTFDVTSQKNITLDQAATSKIEVENEAGAVTYVSNNTDIATVAADGTITAVAPGKTMITVTDAGSETVKGKSVTVGVTVIGTIIVDGDIIIKAGEVPYGYDIDDATSLTLYTYSNWTKEQELFTLAKGQAKVTIPEGVKVTKATLYGVAQDNSGSKGSITELAGKTFSVALNGRKSGTLSQASADNLDITDELTFTVSYKAALKLALTVEENTTDIKGIKTVNKIAINAKKFVKNGKLVIEKAGMQFNAAGAQMK